MPAPHLENRSPQTTGMLGWFDYGHLPPDLQIAARPCSDLAHQMVSILGDGPELSAGLRKLLEAKDCFVRDYIATRRQQGDLSEGSTAGQ